MIFKKLIFLISICSLALFVNGQPTISIDEVQVNAGSNFTVDFRVENFTNIVTLEYSINWDPAIIQLNSTQAYNLDDLIGSDFDMTNKDDGFITLSWSTILENGVTLPDGQVIYQLLFEAIGAVGEISPIEITGSPMPVNVLRSNTGDINIGFEQEDNGSAQLFEGLAELSLFVPTLTNACPGDQICLPITLSPADSLLSVQYSLDWDASVLAYNGIQNINLDAPSVTEGGNLSVFSDSLLLLWVADDFTTGFSVPNGMPLMEVCFDVIGDTGSSSAINFVDVTEAIGIENGITTEHNVTIQNGNVAVDDCSTPVTFSLSLGSGMPGDTVCLQLTTTGFENITGMVDTINWNSTLLEFVNVQNFNLEDLDASDFDGTNNGVLSIDWMHAANTGVTVADGTVLYEICFRITGSLDDQFVDVNFLNSPDTYAITDSTGTELQNVDFNDGRVVINDPGVYVQASEESTLVCETVCVDFSVANFSDVGALQFPITWDTTVLAFQDIQNLNLNGLTIGDHFDTNTNGTILFDWTNPIEGEGVTFTDTTTIFSICFMEIGLPGSNSVISLTDGSNVPAAFNSFEDPINTTSQDGNVAVSNTGLVYNSPDLIVSTAASFCMDVVATSGFDSIFSLDYNFLWDETVLQFDSITNIGLPNMSGVSVNEITNGNMILTWETNDFVNGTSLADGTLIYQMCFTAIGDPGDCTGITYGGNKEVTANVNGQLTANIGLLPLGGNVCLQEFAILESDIIHAACEEDNGEIDITVGGGSGSYLFLWDGMMPGATTEDIADLAPGEYCVTVTDAADANLVLNQCFDVDYLGDIPIAQAGEDQVFGCEDTFLTIDGSNSQSGGTVEYNWVAENGGVFQNGDDSSSVTTITAPGTYILTVTTFGRCVDSDTILVTSGMTIIANASVTDEINCAQTEVILDGTTSSVGENITYIWTTNNGGSIVTGEQTLMPTVDAAGTYTLTVMDTVTNCLITTEINVIENSALPFADAGASLEMSCGQTSATLDGTASSIGANYTYLWTASATSGNITNETTLTPTVDDVGTYILLVTDTNNNCSFSDFVTVDADPTLAVAVAQDTFIIGCGATDVVLDGTGSSVGSNFTFNWLSTGLTVLSDELMYTTQNTGGYLLIVTNTINDCKDTAFVEVVEDQSLPEVNIVQPGLITCEESCATLDASTSSSANEFIAEWTTTEGSFCGTTNSLIAEAGAIGFYTLTITNTLNGCTNSSSVLVDGSQDVPFADAGPTQRYINCLNETVILDGSPSTSGANISYQWLDQDDNELSTTSNVEAITPGEYTFIVTNTMSDCSAMTTITVDVNMDMPTANAGEDINLSDCDGFDNFMLLASNSSIGDNITYLWTSQDGGLIVSGETTLNPMIGAVGTYTLTVTNSTSQCTASDAVIVSSDVHIPVAIIAPLADSTITCTNSSIQIDASASSSDASFYTIDWTGSIAGQNTLTPTVSTGGNYILTITSTEGCTASASILIGMDVLNPTVDAGEDMEIDCHQAVTLAATASSGDNITYLWSSSEGNFVSPDAVTTLSPEVDQSGIYILTVTNSENGCTATDDASVTILQELPSAVAGLDEALCVTETFLTADALIDGITGIWTSGSAAIIESPTDPLSDVSALPEGENQFVWTLSSENCPDYDTDTITITVEVAPITADDIVNISYNDLVDTFSVIGNDDIGSTGWTFTLSSSPAEISSNGNGELIYQGVQNYTGVFSDIQYEICNENCPTLCSSAIVEVIVLPPDLDDLEFTPNTITPNDDGQNDALVFDKLLFQSDKFPDNEIVIFNRWGDEVYQSRPYNNNWNGSTNSNKPLPEGTYYYILRLDVGEGDILRGDVTILR